MKNEPDLPDCSIHRHVVEDDHAQSGEVSEFGT